MKRPLTRDSRGVLRDPFGRPLTFDPEEMQRAHRISDSNRQPGAIKRSIPRAPYVKLA